MFRMTWVLLLALAATSGCAEMLYDSPTGPMGVRLSGNPTWLVFPGIGTDENYIPFHSKVGVEGNIPDTPGAVGLHWGFDIQENDEYELDFYTMSVEGFLYPFTRFDTPGFKPFLSFGYQKANCFESGVDHDWGSQIGFGVSSTAVSRLYIQCFFRDTRLDVNPATCPSWLSGEDIDISDFFIEWGVTFVF